MKPSPRSIMLTWANTIAGWWTSAAVSAIQHQNRAILNAMVKAKPKRGGCGVAVGRWARSDRVDLVSSSLLSGPLIACVNSRHSAPARCEIEYKRPTAGDR
jgi:hypothetical protein